MRESGVIPLTTPVPLERRTLPGSLRYLADKLDDGFNPGAIAMVLRTLASEQEAERHAEATMPP